MMGDDVLFRRSVNDVLLKCINKEDALKVIGEVHEGTCGAHQSGYNMKWTINRYDNYWPTIIKDYFLYARGCEEYQKHGNIQRVPVDELNLVVKPWPFKG